ncbi:cyclin-dependent kinases regulatory subunit [Sporobolomyces koalae]|uniref:cyclin-dependent kinases regulatory subunit n=1 Tax=Sporobolomyces koalae TaxID=500713 RepID=UPI00317815EE
MLSAKELGQKQRDIERWSEEIYYSPRYSDDDFEYRHVIVPKALVKYLPTDRLAEEDEWRGLGIRQSPGWEHYMRHAPEPHILLFKRDKNYGM